jgi:predicted phosphate transport protein (TIGR00153 family)
MEIWLLSDLIKWFEKRRETRALGIMQRHLSITMTIVADLGQAVDAAVKKNSEEMRKCVERITSDEKEADSLRREFMDELSRGELPPSDREDLMHLMKRVDMVADWSRESTRLLNVLPMEKVPESLQNACVRMVEGDKACAVALRNCIEKMTVDRQEALKAADEVERKEEIVDEIHERSRRLLAEEELLKAGVAVLIGQLLESLETVADSCEDACDQVRVIIVRR